MGKQLVDKEKAKRTIENIKPILMTVRDIPQIAEMFILNWGIMCLLPDYALEMIINKNMSYVYKINDEVIAFCLMEYDYEFNVCVDLICVKDKYKGLHLGENILSFCINNCKNFIFRKVHLHVSTTNIPAFNLYKKLGFQIKDYIANYYMDEKPEDSNAYYMELNL